MSVWVHRNPSGPLSTCRSMRKCPSSWATLNRARRGPPAVLTRIAPMLRTRLVSSMPSTPSSRAWRTSPMSSARAISPSGTAASSGPSGVWMAPAKRSGAWMSGRSARARARGLASGLRPVTQRPDHVFDNKAVAVRQSLQIPVDTIDALFLHRGCGLIADEHVDANPEMQRQRADKLEGGILAAALLKLPDMRLRDAGRIGDLLQRLPALLTQIEQALPDVHGDPDI